jgi:adenylate cyclase
MQKMKYFHLKNDMVAVNLLANMAGSFAVEIMARVMIPGAIIASAKALRVADHLFTPAAILFLVLAMVLYERPIRKCLQSVRTSKSISDSDWQKARRRLLNEPFFVIIINSFCWFVGAIIYGLAVKISTGTSSMARFTVMQSLETGCITITIAFFWIEHILQRKMAPVFFPEGNLYATEGT